MKRRPWDFIQEIIRVNLQLLYPTCIRNFICATHIWGIRVQRIQHDFRGNWFENCTLLLSLTQASFATKIVAIVQEQAYVPKDHLFEMVIFKWAWMVSHALVYYLPWVHVDLISCTVNTSNQANTIQPSIPVHNVTKCLLTIFVARSKVNVLHAHDENVHNLKRCIPSEVE